MPDSSRDDYESKRDLDASPEPDAGSGRRKGRPVFVVQRHDATSEHDDLRLEAGGVLKSWAVPKGPSTDPSDKRLAIRTEDHPLDYADFEGVIPDGEYGAGTVMVWDTGPYRNLKDDDTPSVEDQVHDGHATRLRSRNDKDLNDTYPEIADALDAQQTDRFVIDGEIVAFEGNRTSFSRLQQRMKITDADEAARSRVAVYYYAFDVLHLDGFDVTRVPLRDRKRLLRHAIGFEHRLRFTPHRNADGEAYYEEACRKRWECVIAKEAGSPYVHARSRHWLKFKCVNRQELVIGGYTDPAGSRHGFGAIVVGFYDDGDLVCAGRVGTGFDDETLTELGERMHALERKTPPFDRGDTPHAGVHWITPSLVCEVGFTEWTGDDRLRHPRFLGLRRDKDPSDVVKETPS